MTKRSFGWPGGRLGWRCHGLLGTILVPRRYRSACDNMGLQGR
jgi:hypothetical protein